MRLSSTGLVLQIHITERGETANQYPQTKDPQLKIDRRPKTAIFGVGRPKCGKRTHLYHIARAEKAPYLDTGATLRGLKEIVLGLSHSQEGVDYRFLTEQVKTLNGMDPSILLPLKQGGQVNDGFVIRLVKAWINLHRQERLIIIDGTPRTKVQFRETASFLKGNGFWRKTIWFSTPARECLQRPNRGNREDEDPQVLVGRMKDFETFVAPLQPLMKLKTDFLDIDNSDREVIDVRQEILRFLGLGSPTITTGHHHTSHVPQPA